MRAAAAVLLALAATAAAQSCDPDADCRYSTDVNGKLYSWDFRPLCKTGGGDYYFGDSDGHEFFANICGIASKRCLPATWENTYEYGVAVQMWGAQPTCNTTAPECVEKVGNVPACCTQDCQVLGVGWPSFSLVDTHDVNQGVRISFRGALPTEDDPFWCPWNAAAGRQYERTVHYIMQCDLTEELAKEVTAVTNATEKCDYYLTFKSRYACANHHFNPGGGGGGGKLSGGWIFVIIVLVLAVVYFGGGFLFTYHTERVWAPPNRRFWSSLCQYTSDGVSFIGSGCKRGGSSKAIGGAAGASPYDEITAGGGGGGGGGSASYSASSYNASSAPATTGTAYTDL